MTIGIPKFLIYWKKPDFWESFFKSLGFDVLLSPPTNKDIVEKGVKVSDPETCFSNKVYWGHLLWLDGKCDMIFVPRLKANQEKLEYCPKFFGLPDLAEILVKTPVLTEIFDQRRESFAKSVEKLGQKLGVSKKEIRRALQNAESKEKEIESEKEESFLQKINSPKRKIVLISHPYNLYDDYVNLRIKEKLEKLGSQAVFLENLPLKMAVEESFPEINFHWEFGREIMAKIEGILKYKIEGALEISSFQCGCDAVLKEFVEKRFKKAKIPFLYLIIDEQTGEAGLQTRIEAFLDTIR